MVHFIQKFIARQFDHEEEKAAIPVETGENSTKSSYHPSIKEGLQAKVKDPLWFLCRQWQMAEFEAGNGGSPIRMTYEIEDRSMDEIVYHDGHAQIFDISVPLEPIIEGGSDKSMFDNAAGFEDDVISDQIQKTPRAWKSDRLEYSFKLRESSEPDNARKMVLNAREYFGERMDWYSFTLNKKAQATNTRKIESIPQPVDFPGMPKVRFWEFEDYRINIENLVRDHPLTMLLTDFLMLFSNDYFIFPMEQTAGTLRSIGKVEVTDVFGDTVAIQPHVTVQDDGFALFAHNEDDNSDSVRCTSANLFLPNKIAQSYTSDPLEEIIFYRDEIQEMVWAVERKYWNKGVIDRADELSRKEPEQTQAAGNTKSSLPKYIIKTPVPEHWIPYQPQQTGNSQFILRRARTDSKFNKDNPQYKSAILSESKWICEEEIQSVPVLLTQYVEMTSVQTGDERKRIFWIGRQKQRGKMKEQIKLSFDRLEKV